MKPGPGSGRLGLRPRLILAFVLLGLVTAMAAAGASYIQARNTILRSTQDTTVRNLTAKLTQRVKLVTFPPSQQTLEWLAEELRDDETSVLVVYGDRTSAGDGSTPAEFSGALHRAVTTGTQVVWQRTTIAGSPALTFGTPVMLREGGGPAQASGLQVYAARSLSSERDSIGALAVTAWLISVPALLFAVLLALLAARGVLRPVRELGTAARRWGSGDLATRLDVRGSDELAELAATFNTSADAVERHVGDLRRLEAESRRFVADVSHELRTPLAAMTAVTDVLDEEAEHLTPDAAAAARLVSQETGKLTRLVNDLIEVSRFDSGTAGLVLDDVDVAAAVRATLRARGWAGLVECELPEGTVARLDPRRLDVIVANLVGNALRHGAPPVTVRLTATADQVTLRVGDRGPGLAPGVQERVFDRFYKADSARTRSEGSGLGLAIAWENARLHHGSLAAATDPAGGAVFTLTLPRGLS